MPASCGSKHNAAQHKVEREARGCPRHGYAHLRKAVHLDEAQRLPPAHITCGIVVHRDPKADEAEPELESPYQPYGAMPSGDGVDNERVYCKWV